jgi:hypothetical protein
MLASVFVLAGFVAAIAFLVGLVSRRRRRTAWRVSLGGLAAVVVSFVAAMFVGPAPQSPHDPQQAADHKPVAVVSAQQQLCTVLTQFRDRAAGADDNAVARVNVEAARRAEMPVAVEAVMGVPGVVIGWEVEVDLLTVAPEGAVRLVLEAGCDIELVMPAEAGVTASSAGGRMLSAIGEGDGVLVSGFLLPGAATDRDKGFPYREYSVTPEGALRVPELGFVVTGIYQAAGDLPPVADEILAVQSAAQAHAEAVAAVEVACRADIQCWGERHLSDANMACREPVERLAQYQHEWTDGMLENKFYQWRWAADGAADGSIVSYFGDRLKMQNGFGAWAVVTYRCDYNFEAGTVVDVMAAPGTL